MFDTVFWGTLLRTGQLVVEAAPTLLCGLVVAGVMRRMMGAAAVRRLFGGQGWRGLFRAWVIGSLLPVCSFGVIPVAREMRRAGVPVGTILAFLLAAPQINPISLLYGLTLSEPVVIVWFAAACLLLALVAGWFWDRFLARPEDAVPPGDEPMPPPGLRRLAAVAVTAGREASNPTMGYILLGLLFSGLVSGLLPFGSLGATMRHDDWTSPLLMTALSLPCYVGPLQGMMRIGLIFEHGNSVGASFVLFQVGVGVNLGLLVWLLTQFGRRVLVWLAFVVALTLALAYAAERPLYRANMEADHTHAFDDWSCPFVAGSAVEPRLVLAKLAEKLGLLERFCLGGIGLLMLLGLAARRLDRDGRLEAFLTRPAPASDRPLSVWQRPIPGPVLGVFALLGLVLFGVVAMYLYYPPPETVFEDMTAARVNTVVSVRTRQKAEAIRRLEHWDLLTRKLQVGVFIRTGRFDEEAGKIAEELRERIEEMRDALLVDDFDAAQAMLPVLEAEYRSCRAAFLKQP